MYEYKYSIGVRHKSTGEKLKLEVWAEDVDAATHKLTAPSLARNVSTSGPAPAPSTKTTSSSAVKRKIEEDITNENRCSEHHPRQGH